MKLHVIFFTLLIYFGVLWLYELFHATIWWKLPTDITEKIFFICIWCLKVPQLLPIYYRGSFFQKATGVINYSIECYLPKERLSKVVSIPIHNVVETFMMLHLNFVTQIPYLHHHNPALNANHMQEQSFVRKPPGKNILTLKKLVWNIQTVD